MTQYLVKKNNITPVNQIHKSHLSNKIDNLDFYFFIKFNTQLLKNITFAINQNKKILS